MNINDEQLDAYLKRLHLANIRHNWREVIDRAEKEKWSYRDFLATLAAEEVGKRSLTGIKRRIHAAKFPFLKTLEEFNFEMQSRLEVQMLGSYVGHELVTGGRCLVLYGKPGRGKTHLAIALAHKAILNGYHALFTTAADVIEDLHVAAAESNFRQRLKRYTAPDVLIVDEVGYLSLRDNAANVLYHVVNARYLKKKPILFTTNKPLTQWGHVLHDPDLAETIIDRVLERGRIVMLDGPSMRNPEGLTPPES